jgi:ribosome biogenesis protein BRX1
MKPKSRKQKRSELDENDGEISTNKKSKSSNAAAEIVEALQQEIEAKSLAEAETSHPSDRRAMKWKRRTRVLVLCSRQVDYRSRHLAIDLRNMMPHAKSDCKFNRKRGLAELNSMAEMKNCSKIMYFEGHNKKDLYMFMADHNIGVTAIFLVHNICTMAELKLTGNCLKASRPVLSFDNSFNDSALLRLYKELFVGVFSTPQYHPRSQPFIDHVYTFTLVDGKIWFRNYQIVKTDNKESSGAAEIGPRMVLEPIKILSGSFDGTVIYKNRSFLTPNATRRFEKQQMQKKSYNKLLDQMHYTEKKKRKGKVMEFDDETDFMFKEGILSDAE